MEKGRNKVIAFNTTNNNPMLNFVRCSVKMIED